MSEEFACPSCEFTTDSERSLTIHCGSEHTVENNPYRIECECVCCGEYFTMPKSNYDQGTGDYCSKECYAEDQKQRNRVERECEYCGDTFSVLKSRVERGGGVCCSSECASKRSRNRVSCTCEYCGDEFTIRESAYERQGAKYCSNECQGMAMRGSNPDTRQSPQYRQWREDVLERDDYSCQDCGAEDELHAHHITPVSENQERVTDMDNGVTVCVDCHQRRHEERGDEKAANLLRAA